MSGSGRGFLLSRGLRGSSHPRTAVSPRCNEGRIGRICECSKDEVRTEDLDANCRKDNGTEICSNNGDCVCGTCECKKRENSAEVYSGKYCECDNFNCDRSSNKLCGGERSRCADTSADVRNTAAGNMCSRHQDTDAASAGSVSVTPTTPAAPVTAPWTPPPVWPRTDRSVTDGEPANVGTASALTQSSRVPPVRYVPPAPASAPSTSTREWFEGLWV